MPNALLAPSKTRLIEDQVNKDWENNLLEEILRLDLEHFDDFCYKVEG